MVSDIQETVAKCIIELKEIMGNIDAKQEKFFDNILKKLYLNENTGKINVVPVKSGFGKSLAIKVFLRGLVKEKMKEDSFDGVIVVTDNLKRLREIRDFKGLEDMCYLMQHLDETEVELIDRFEEQVKKQSQYPILLMTSQRYELLSEKMRTMFYGWQNGNRNLVIFDEKPFFYRVTDIDVKYIYYIKEKIDVMPEGKQKNYIVNVFRKIETKIEDLKEKLANDTQPIKWVKGKGIDCSILENIEIEKEFLEIAKRNLQPNSYVKISKIFDFYKNGGLFVNRKKKDIENSRFFCLIEDNFEKFDLDKVNYWIFDATAENDVEYSYNNMFNIIRVDDEKKENLKIFNVRQNMSKQAMVKNNNIVTEGLNNFIKNNVGLDEKFLVATYLKFINKININQNGEKIHFGNIKGYNNYREIKKMFHVGWNRQNDYFYLGIYLLLNKEIINTLNLLSTEEANKELKNLLSFKKVDNVNTIIFEKDEINEVMISKIFVDFEQNIYRTKIRDFNNNDEIVIYIFSNNSILYKEIFKLIEYTHDIKIINIKSAEFGISKIKARKNQKESIAQKLVRWWTTYNWQEELHIAQILKINGITQKQFNKAKENNKALREFINRNKSKYRNYYYFYNDDKLQ